MIVGNSLIAPTVVMQGYESMSLDRKDYEGQRVLVIGRGAVHHADTATRMWLDICIKF